MVDAYDKRLIADEGVLGDQAGLDPSDVVSAGRLEQVFSD
jgi:hypothetical protein